MKLFFVPALLALCLPFATAKPCLSQSDVNTLSTHFGDLVSAYSQKLANQTLTVNFVDYSESIITLMDSAGTTPKALLGMAFTSRANFEAESSAQPSVPFQVQNTWHNCDTITIRWLSAQSPQPVVGISVLQTVYRPGRGNATNFKINEVWAEFDSAAWLIDLGFTITPPSSKKREIAFEA
ncbi:hypothetical protein LTR35_014576 [Friedmanniomyces endolithicus]|uniref:NTF2-like domain-containing protein n=1 Tax=Friedmanniomyces endolithicus TaxID=329885 RepID=A0AAN6J518_9PEZI|nr:hypothetical protein LTR35_014576 [Friedmanniomyces endolithicus]KAK0274782.1 hypothetical protein LTS00_015277 [Friedmanniomyces endolithicus]KAK0316110.1 hypothetical protein LTR82_012404 [Friedmanniomyces endolithicus]KAK0985644.1 hypothetical protein LTR54_013722 [Friedmanniomyces endolithicus]KAK1058061.1 hypothetical protein LTR74_013666 [Friedmanniomyces endolithicus]